MKEIVLTLLLAGAGLLSGQNAQKLQFNREYAALQIGADADVVFEAPLEKGRLYQFAAMQQGIDVLLALKDENGHQLVEKDSPNGKYGKELFEYTPLKTRVYRFSIKRFEEEGNAAAGQISFYVKAFNDADMRDRNLSKKALEAENSRVVLTADIDHFWEAFDALPRCKNHYDSVTAFQNLYLDRATDGLLDFIERRDLYADDFVRAVRDSGAFYQRVRENTFSVKKAEPLIQGVFDTLKQLYSNFKPFQVCFAIGKMRTGGTTSDRFVLIGTELTTTGAIDKIPQRIKGIVAHECVHTQQPDRLDSNAVACNQLYFCLREGSANFIGELVTGTTNYNEVNQYGDAHEAALWADFKATLCRSDASDWMYNGDTVKDKPADLGYFVGYKICQAYYEKAQDKRQAIRDIIDIDDPLAFLQKSGYDQKAKK